MPQPDLTTKTAPSSLTALFEQYSGRVVAAAFRVTGSRQDAEDVLQTVFLRLARRWQEIELTETVGSYLYRAAINASLDLLRARKRSRAIAVDDLPVELPDSSDVSAERRLEDTRFRQALREALLTLSERSAQIFVLRYFEGLGNKELARMMGMRPVTVAVNLHRARKRLQGELRQLVKGES